MSKTINNLVALHKCEITSYVEESYTLIFKIFNLIELKEFLKLKIEYLFNDIDAQLIPCLKNDLGLLRECITIEQVVKVYYDRQLNEWFNYKFSEIYKGGTNE